MIYVNGEFIDDTPEGLIEEIVARDYATKYNNINSEDIGRCIVDSIRYHLIQSELNGKLDVSHIGKVILKLVKDTNDHTIVNIILMLFANKNIDELIEDMNINTHNGECKVQ